MNNLQNNMVWYHGHYITEAHRDLLEGKTPKPEPQEVQYDRTPKYLEKAFKKLEGKLRKIVEEKAKQQFE